MWEEESCDCENSCDHNLLSVWWSFISVVVYNRHETISKLSFVSLIYSFSWSLISVRLMCSCFQLDPTHTLSFNLCLSLVLRIPETAHCRNEAVHKFQQPEGLCFKPISDAQHFFVLWQRNWIQTQVSVVTHRWSFWVPTVETGY